MEQDVTTTTVKITFDTDFVVLANSATVLREDTVTNLMILKAVMEKRESCDAVVLRTPKARHSELESHSNLILQYLVP